VGEKMSDCEFIKLCEEAFGATVPGCKDDHWRGCPNYDLCVRVHNQAIDKVLKEMKSWGIGKGNALLHSTLALKMVVG